jgi:hypothetical protein
MSRGGDRRPSYCDEGRRIAANIAKLPELLGTKLTSRQLLYGTIWKARPPFSHQTKYSQVKLMRILSFEELKSLKHITWNKEHIAKLVSAGLFPGASRTLTIG